MLGTADDPIRVLRVIARLNVGGPSLHVSYLSEGLAERGYSTTLAAGTISEGEASMAFIAEERGIEIESIPELQRELAPLKDAAAVRRLRTIIRRERPHILHTHTAKAGTVGRAAARIAGDARPPVVVHTFHGHMLKGEFDPVRTRAFRAVERNLARTTDVLVAVSPEVRDELVEVGVAPASQFAVVRLGIELSERMAGASDGASLRASLGIPPDRFCVGWVARMSAVKQPEDVLRTVRKLRDRGIDAALILIGDGPEREQLEERAKELGLVEGVHFVGFQNDVGPWLHAFDVLLLTSRSEGTPVSAIETLASGRPVVATDVGGTRDVVNDGVSGFLVPFGDVSAAADRLERLARDPALRARMGAAGQAVALSSYGVPRLVGDIDRLYRALLTEKGYSVAAGGDTPAKKRQ
ncbi:MAG: glycosyltransferase family 1 protein [Thermoleophilia bacterium]|nr:glycosyltransferase family 1 protein [Thermoleophilia bacterium]